MRPQKPLGHGTDPCRQRAPRLWPECWNTTVWRDALSNSLSSATAYTKAFRQILLKNVGNNMWCVRYTDKGFGVIRSTLFPQFLDYDLYRDLNLYSQGHPRRIFFFIRKMLCCYYFFSLLSAGARILYSARHNSCSVLLDQNVKNYVFSTASISSCLNMMSLFYPPWLLMPSF